jgi:hypothetical protein
MSRIAGGPPAAVSAIAGIQKGMQRFDQAAAAVATAGPAASNAAVLSLSPEAQAAASQAHGAGLEEAMIDTRIAKHTVAANIRTLQTVDAMSKELIDLLGSR